MTEKKIDPWADRDRSKVVHLTKVERRARAMCMGFEPYHTASMAIAPMYDDLDWQVNVLRPIVVDLPVDGHVPRDRIPPRKESP
jgi:hypothetical protein